MSIDVVKVVNEEELVQHILISDEATFHTCETVTDIIVIYGQMNNRVQSQGGNEILPKVNVWLDMRMDKMYGLCLQKTQSIAHVILICCNCFCIPSWYKMVLLTLLCFNRMAHIPILHLSIESTSMK